MKKGRLWDRDFVERGGYQGSENRKAVCKRCGCILVDLEPESPRGEFYHDRRSKKGVECSNSCSTFDTTSPEIEPFMRKKDRRRLKRLKIRA